MFVSKLMVLVAHEEPDFDTERVLSIIEAAIGPVLDRRAIFEVSDGGTSEVTLAAIASTLEERANGVPAAESRVAGPSQS